MKKHCGHIRSHIGPLYMEAGYFRGMYMEGDPFAEVSIAQNIDMASERYFNFFNLRIWRLVLSVSVDFKKGVEE